MKNIIMSVLYVQYSTTVKVLHIKGVSMRSCRVVIIALVLHGNVVETFN